MKTAEVPILTSVAKRFWSKATIAGPDDCWEWQSALHPDGYGNFGISGASVLAHRVAWALSRNADRAPIGFVCHSCDNRRCVNPKHLFLGDNTANMRDMVAKGRHRQQKKTHCPKGHEYTPENTRLSKRGTWVSRICRICGRNQTSQSYFKRKAQRELFA